MQTYEMIQRQVGEWAVANFGHNETPYLGVLEQGSILPDKPRKDGDKPDDTARFKDVVVELGSLAPLMGLVEELGEFMEALTEKDRENALGDMAIYLCDYCHREGLAFPTRFPWSTKKRHEASIGMAVFLGRLYHCTLKRHQRIRKMHNPKQFNKERLDTLRGFVWHLEAAAKEYTSTNLLATLNKTWNEIVRKRNWRADAAKGTE